MSGRVALVFIFNHRYDKNIDVLENIYKDRFSDIYHLVPFYTGDKENVIPVYENSFYFQGYIAQGFKQFQKECYDHYLFVADDLILNPLINENNYKDFFHLQLNNCYIPEIFTLHHLTNNDTLRFTVLKNFYNKRSKLYWWRIKELVKYRHKLEGVENDRELPTRKQAYEQLLKHGFEVKPLSFTDIYGFFPLPFFSKQKLHQALRFIYRIKKYWKQFSTLR